MTGWIKQLHGAAEDLLPQFHKDAGTRGQARHGPVKPFIATTFPRKCVTWAPQIRTSPCSIANQGEKVNTPSTTPQRPGTEDTGISVISSALARLDKNSRENTWTREDDEELLALMRFMNISEQDMDEFGAE